VVKLKDIIEDLELGKVYTDKDRPPFKVESTASYAASLEKMAKDRKLKMISKKDKMLLTKLAKMMKNANESVNEKVNTDIKQIYKLLLKYGQSAKDASKMMKKHWKYVSKKYRNSSPRGVAMALIGLHALGEGMQKQRNELALHIIDLNNMLGQAKLSKNPNTKKYIKLLQQDLKDAKKKLGKLKND